MDTFVYYVFIFRFFIIIFGFGFFTFFFFTFFTFLNINKTSVLEKNLITTSVKRERHLPFCVSCLHLKRPKKDKKKNYLIFLDRNKFRQYLLCFHVYVSFFLYSKYIFQIFLKQLCQDFSLFARFSGK